MAEVKVTRAQMFAEIKAVVEASDVAGKEEMIKFIDHQVELIASKAEKAKAKAATKKAEADEMEQAVAAVLTAELQTVDEIVAQVEGEEVTRAKVVARLKKLVEAGVAAKDSVKVEKSKRVAYRLADATDEVAEADAE